MRTDYTMGFGRLMLRFSTLNKSVNQRWEIRFYNDFKCYYYKIILRCIILSENSTKMKRLASFEMDIFYTCFLAAVILSFYGCNNCPPASPTDVTKCGPCMDYNQSGAQNKLDLNLLRTMTFNYQHDVAADGTINPVNLNKTRSVWIPLSQLKQFIYEIESNACNTCGEDAQLGVRIYFGNYPSNDDDWTGGFRTDLDNPGNSFRSRVLDPNTSNNTYLGLTTLFMVPTINREGTNYDFDPANHSYGCNPGYDLTTIFRKLGKDSSQYYNSSYFLHHALGLSVTALTAANHGEACPPPFGGCVGKGAFTDFDNH